MAGVMGEGNVLLLGLKLDNSGRELLTWSLAKFSNAGDHVIALHVTTSPSQADGLKSKFDAANMHSEGDFDSIIGVYKSFCSIKQVDLEVRVIHGSSLRRALIEEARKARAAKLVLGHASTKPHLGASYSLAKYCAKRLPTTCSVAVIEHGQVTFEIDGVLKSLDSAPRVLNTIQRSLRSHSWKGTAYQHMDVRRSSISVRTANEVDMGHDDDDNYGKPTCYWPLSSRFLDSPVSVLHEFKCPSPIMQSSRRTSTNMGSPLSAASSPMEASIPEEVADVLSVDHEGNKVRSSQVTLRDCFFQNLGDEHPEFCGDKAHEQGLTTSTHEMDVGYEGANAGDEVLATALANNGAEGANNGSNVDDEVLERDTLDNTIHDDITPSAGWPLLHRALVSTKMNHHSKRYSNQMSVVEWALQLPDRPKEVFNQATDLVAKTMSDGSHSGNSGGSWHAIGEQQYEEEDSSISSATLANPQGKLASRAACFSINSPCKEFHFEELQAATGNFSVDNVVGRGGCSQVYRGAFADDSIVAVKRLNACSLDSEDDFLTEVEIMCSLQHGNIVQLIGYCVESQHYSLVYNFASEGNLEQRLHGGKGKAPLPWDPRFSIAVGVAEALKYLHDGCTRPVIHRDVKSSNILLSSNLEPQLTDFGLAKWASSTSTQVTCSDVVGTFGYLAPEYFMFGKVSEKTDVYSFGVVLLELITGRRPIDNTRPKGEENLVVWARPLLEDEAGPNKLIDPKLEGAYNSAQLKNMMIAAALCLRQSPQMRPRIRRIWKLLTGEVEDLDHIGRQESVSKESDDGYEMPNYGDIDIRTHLTLALLGVDDDAASQASIEHSVNLAHSNKYLEEYLGGRYSRSSSFE